MKNSAKINASLCAFPSVVLCKLKIHPLLIKGVSYEQLWVQNSKKVVRATLTETHNKITTNAI